MKVWNDDKNKLAMARAFSGHHQFVASIIAHGGDNDYLSKKGGLSFGVRRTFIRNEDGDGVVPVTLAPEAEGQTVQGQFLHQNQMRGLKYKKPALSELQRATLTKEMKELLLEHMDGNLMDGDMHAAWFELSGREGDGQQNNQGGGGGQHNNQGGEAGQNNNQA